MREEVHMNEDKETIVNDENTQENEVKEESTNQEQMVSESQVEAIEETETEVEAQAEEKPKKVPLLERLVKRIFTEEGEQKEEYKKVKEVISEDPRDGDVWETGDGKVVISHTGIKKLADYVGAEWDEGELDDRPNSNNDKGFYFRITCRFPDGSKSKEVGSAHDKNAKGDISLSHKYEMAYKRAQDRAFLNSSYMKMYDVYSAEESDSWSKEEMLKRQLEQQERYIKETLANGNAQLQAKEDTLRRYIAFSDRLLYYVALPQDDEKYPGEHITSIIEREDYEYLQRLQKSDDKTMVYIVNRLLKLSNLTLEEQTARDEAEASTQFNEATEEQKQEVVTDNQSTDNVVNEQTTEVVSEASTQNHEQNTESSVPILEKAGPTGEKQVKNEQPKPFTLEPIGDDGDELETVDFRLGDDTEDRES